MSRQSLIKLIPHHVPPSVATGLMLIVLVIAGTIHLAGVRDAVDVPLDDEAHYLCSGLAIADKMPAAHLAPLYGVWYSALSKLNGDKIGLFYLNVILLSIINPALLFLALRRFRVPLLPALVVALLFLVSFANTAMSPRVGHFALTIVLLSFIAAASVRPAWKIAVLTLGALFASYIRPEFYVAFGILLVLQAASAYKDAKCSRYARSWLLLFTIAAAVGLRFLWGIPLFGERRSLLAFGQHYAINHVAWTGDTSIDPWWDWARVFARDFGTAGTIASAALSNPALFLKHVLWNVGRLPSAIFETACRHSPLLFPAGWSDWEAAAVCVATLAFLLFASIVMRKRIRQTRPEGRILLGAAAAYGATIAIAAVVIAPRYHYLIVPEAIFPVILLSLIASRAGRPKQNLAWLLVLSAVMILITPRSIAFRPESGTQNGSTIHFLRSLGITDTVVLCEAEEGITLFLDRNYSTVLSHGRKNEGFASYLRHYGINMVLLTDRLLKDPRFRDDPEWKAFLNEYERHGFVRKEIPGTRRAVLVDVRLLE
jgi:hypothetical protein